MRPVATGIFCNIFFATDLGWRENTAYLISLLRTLLFRPLCCLSSSGFFCGSPGMKPDWPLKLVVSLSAIVIDVIIKSALLLQAASQRVHISRYIGSYLLPLSGFRQTTPPQRGLFLLTNKPGTRLHAGSLESQPYCRFIRRDHKYGIFFFDSITRIMMDSAGNPPRIYHNDRPVQNFLVNLRIYPGLIWLSLSRNTPPGLVDREVLAAANPLFFSCLRILETAIMTFHHFFDQL